LWFGILAGNNLLRICAALLSVIAMEVWLVFRTGRKVIE
jgi:hypothetical protein